MRYHVISNWKDTGIKIGFFGLAERDWYGCLSPKVYPEGFEYQDFIEAAREMNSLLRDVMQCDFVIALTHMRLPNDRILANSVAEIDLILGGHDHGYEAECNGETGVFIVKSWTDFDDFSDIDLVFNIQSQE